ncbi:Voltage gated chloride channel [Musa troglodytarum]|uniref:Voltage gated chloride channel n=1 Tax=Musa troglodytarum TaxID=320322 RepID=A0A9E7FR85_9LILI|nr:Voltage gated chloride channel [Musa troglodytarum]URE00661.1 Voltage gated chloride channel [Musa troglodytarum]
MCLLMATCATQNHSSLPTLLTGNPWQDMKKFFCRNLSRSSLLNQHKEHNLTTVSFGPATSLQSASPRPVEAPSPSNSPALTSLRQRHRHLHPFLIHRRRLLRADVPLDYYGGTLGLVNDTADNMPLCFQLPQGALGDCIPIGVASDEIEAPQIVLDDEEDSKVKVVDVINGLGRNSTFTCINYTHKKKDTEKKLSIFGDGF